LDLLCCQIFDKSCFFLTYQESVSFNRHSAGWWVE